LAGDFPFGAVTPGVVFVELAFAVAFLVVPFIWPPSYGKFATKRTADAGSRGGLKHFVAFQTVRISVCMLIIAPPP
jgi:hypothetical protein